MFSKKIVWHKLFDSVAAAEQRIAINQTTTIQVGTKKLCIAHTASGFYAVNDRCPHNGYSLGKGKCTDDDLVVCPIHRYAFDLKTGRSKNGSGFAKPYPIEIREEGVFVGLEERSWNLF